MTQPSLKDLPEMEATLKAHGVRMGEFYAKAKIQSSTWRRWASGEFEPTMRLWRRACEAYDALIGDAGGTREHGAPPVSGAALNGTLPDDTIVTSSDSGDVSQEAHTTGATP